MNVLLSKTALGFLKPLTLYHFIQTKDLVHEFLENGSTNLCFPICNLSKVTTFQWWKKYLKYLLWLVMNLMYFQCESPTFKEKIPKNRIKSETFNISEGVNISNTFYSEILKHFDLVTLNVFVLIMLKHLILIFQIIFFNQSMLC